jgi:nanoRNase/pAp phosphatase (c-di-AMP/oligoRNAs hydrolase)
MRDHGEMGIDLRQSDALLAELAAPSRPALEDNAMLPFSILRGASGEPSPSQKRRVSDLLDALRARKGGRHVVVIRGYPDPDSLASAWAHLRLAASIDIECDIVHLSLLSRAENRAMVNLLDLPILRISRVEELERYTALSLVDANAIELPRSSGLPCVSIVDHHSVSGKVEADFVDIRTSVGATSTIYTEYLRESPAFLLEHAGTLSRLATALAYGIRSDTDDLLEAAPADLRALGDLTEHVDRDVLANLSRYAIPGSAMAILGRAIEAARVEGTWVFAGVGPVRPEDRDAIGQAADFLLRRDGIKTVLVFGMVGGTIDGSLRTSDVALDPALWLREAFGIGPRGLPYGGGRRGKGGFQIPLGPLVGTPNKAALWGVCKEMIESTIRRQIGTGEAENAPERSG